MRVLVVRPGPRFSVQDVADGWVRAFEQLVDVADFNLDDRLDFYDSALAARGGFGPADTIRLASKSLEACLFEWWPDVLFVISGFFVPPELLACARARGMKTVLLATESPYNDDRHAEIAPFYDLVILNDPTNVDRIAAVTRCEWVPHSWDPAVHYRRTQIDPDWRSEFCFVGTGYPSRVEFFEQVDWSGIDAAFAGNWQSLTPDSPLQPFLAHDRRWCLDNTDAHNLYSATEASAHVYRVEADRPELSSGWAMAPREVELAAVGCFFMTEERGENAAVLPDTPKFVSPEDFGERLRWWLERPDARAAVAATAREAVADRTFARTASRALGWIERL